MNLILLCAGASTRMGFPKGLLMWEGKPLLLHQIESFLALGMKNEIVLVLGYHHERYRECLSGKFLPQVKIVMNPQPERGQFSSLQVGVNALEEKSWSFLLPVDCPSPKREVWSSLWQARDELKSAVIPTVSEKAGHPLLLGKKLLTKIFSSPADERLDSLLKMCPMNEKKYVAVEDTGIHANINTLPCGN